MMKKPFTKPPPPRSPPSVPYIGGPPVYDEIIAIIDGVDHVAVNMEAKWGVGRLELLVDDELRLRFRRQLEKFNEAIEQHEINRVRRHGAGMHKAWSTLDQAATFAGAAPLDPLVWEVAGADGRVIGVTRSNADAFSATRSGRWVEVWTLEELARVVDAWPEIGRTKQTFPGAKIVRVRSKRPINWSQGDDLPFC